MPAPIALVLDQAAFASQVTAALQAMGHETVALDGPIAALEALENAARIELLVTCLDHGINKPNGVALARMARLRRPGIKVLFVGDPALQRHTVGLGAFIASPVAVSDVVRAAAQMTEIADRPGEFATGRSAGPATG
jgi:DNA-binding NtrC family response regulator